MGISTWLLKRDLVIPVGLKFRLTHSPALPEIALKGTSPYQVT